MRRHRPYSYSVRVLPKVKSINYALHRSHRYVNKLKSNGGAKEIYHMIQSVHQEEADKNTVDGTDEDEYPQLPVVYRVQDRYRALYDLLLNPVVDQDDRHHGGSSKWLLSKIAKYREACLCGTQDSGSNGQMAHACPSGMILDLLTSLIM